MRQVVALHKRNCLEEGLQVVHMHAYRTPSCVSVFAGYDLLQLCHAGA